MTTRICGSTWRPTWAGRSYVLMPGTHITVLERRSLWGAAKVQFPNPEPIGEPRTVIAVVPLIDLDAHTDLVPW